MQRRKFIRLTGAMSIATFLPPRLLAELERDMEEAKGPVPRRPLGRTGEELSVIGLGGIAIMGGSQKEADLCVAQAVERGVNYFDVAPTYGGGEAERKLGPALKPYRDKAFLACKTQKRDKEGAADELRGSLKQLGTDYFDLYQLHAITDVKGDVDRALAPGGAMEAFQEAKQKGLVRFLGFSAHSAEAALRAVESGLFDTILYPVNFVCHFQGDFDQEVLASADARGMGLLALKAMARTTWPDGPPGRERQYPNCWYQPISDPAEAALALRWTLARGATAAIPPGDDRLFTIAMNVAAIERPLEGKEEAALRELASRLAPIFRRAA